MLITLSLGGEKVYWSYSDKKLAFYLPSLLIRIYWCRWPLLDFFSSDLKDLCVYRSKLYHTKFVLLKKKIFRNF